MGSLSIVSHLPEFCQVFPNNFAVPIYTQGRSGERLCQSIVSCPRTHNTLTMTKRELLTFHSVCLSVSELSSAEYVKAACKSKEKLQKFTVAVHVNLVISHCCFATNGSEIVPKMYNARAAIIQLIKPSV